MSVDGDRSMVTHGHPAPDARARDDRHAAAVPRRDGRPATPRTVGAGGPRPGWTVARADGALVFADVGWDPTGRWSPHVLDQLERCDAFLPNAVEAMAYTGTDTPRDALYALADLVPLAVVTNGADGASAIDSTTGEEAEVPALRVQAIDPTGAGDVFGAAMRPRHPRRAGRWPPAGLRAPLRRARRAAVRRVARRARPR